jgi:hypothetical protein
MEPALQGKETPDRRKRCRGYRRSGQIPISARSLEEKNSSRDSGRTAKVMKKMTAQAVINMATSDLVSMLMIRLGGMKGLCREGSFVTGQVDSFRRTGRIR